jgi:radical SAM superfamily enzyme YgiQ (UPF0313 family)
MSRKVIDHLRRRHAAETTDLQPGAGGRLAVALVYPNTYHQAMSNLGFLSVHRWFNLQDGVRCERFVLPDPDDVAEHQRSGTPMLSIESQRPLHEFDLIAFSLSFENDYLHLPLLFELGRLPYKVADRDGRSPLTLAGGVCAFLNPEPFAELFDLVAVGEAEAILPQLLPSLLEDAGRTDANLRHLATLPGIYVPSLPPSDPVQRQWLADLDLADCRSFITTPDTEFGDMALTEVSRGCARGCRFCAAGYIYRPPRERSLDAVLRQVDVGLCQHTRQGLVSAAIGDYPHRDALQQAILDRGGSVSVASLRMDTLTAVDVAVLKESGHKTVALAPEAGSQRLRDAINKQVDTPQILRAVSLLAAGSIPNLKLYVLIGLPGETVADHEELLVLVEQIRNIWLEAGRARGRLGQIHLSVNPFVPKPFTPLQWAPMATESELKAVSRRLRTAIGRMPNVTISFESPRAALLQGLLSRGDRRLAAILPELAAGERYPFVCRRHDIDAEAILHRPYTQHEPLPWESIDIGVERDWLWQEYQNYRIGTLTPPCVAGCTRCGTCV